MILLKCHTLSYSVILWPHSKDRLVMENKVYHKMSMTDFFCLSQSKNTRQGKQPQRRMSLKLFLLLLGALFVSMVTAVPLANQEQAVAAEEADNPKDRAKRADEQIVFGNQQNTAGVVSKKSDLSNIPSNSGEEPETPTPGELDNGSEVTVHKALPVDKDLAERVDAARKDFEDEDKIADAMEAAMESVDKEEDSGDEAPLEPEQASDDDANAETTANEQTASETGDDNGSEGDDSSNDEDDDIKDLVQVTSGSKDEEEDKQTKTDDGAVEQVDSAEDSESEPNSQGSGEDQNPLPAVASNMRPVPGDSGRNGEQIPELLRQIYQYVDAYPVNGQAPYDPYTQPYGYDMYRLRRSKARSKQTGARRIKRDLLDDAEYDPALARYLYGGVDSGIDTDSRYGEPSSVLDMGDSLISDPDDYVPLTQADAEELYNELEDYLQYEIQRREGAEKLREILGLGPRDTANEDEGEEYYGNTAADVANPEDDRGLLEGPGQLYPLGGQYQSDEPYYYTSKRGADKRDSSADELSKRYFFPFADEPATHWGAFVPEKRAMLQPSDEQDAYLDDAFLEEYGSPTKRDYDEAILRLQRLAMALSDNQDGYLNEEQPYKK
ncbi:hypothetical protein PoB_006866100 [Plakobranchus ocellatus]|uniref:Uncharacterized protein n=1 Tax=Plakobranchus ocellatus TaxID=259542 RepID=A0AAV4DDI2_9GAST|nr:hypothetical protein PoB_006866100 [Plakobranchus ocellatus]